MRDLRFARGRFLLMGAVVALIAVLTVILTGFANGLVRAGVSGLQRLPATHLAFQQGVPGSLFSRSTVDTATYQTWRHAPGVEDAALYGNSLAHATVQRNGTELDLALFGAEPGSFIAPEPVDGQPLGSSDAGVLVSAELTSQGVRIGDELVVDRVGARMRVVGTLGDLSFGHVPVVWAPLELWQRVHYGLPGTPPAQAFEEATAVALRLAPDADTGTTDTRAHTRSMPTAQSFGQSPGYSAETSTMTLIRVSLHVISMLVVGAFFVVWTVQRRAELALVRALGGSSGYLLRDALAQVLVVLVAASTVGAAVGTGLGLVLANSVPFSLEPSAVVLAGVLLVVLGALGALAAVRRVTSADPLLALEGNR